MGWLGEELERKQAFHRFLLRISGRVPDDLLALARDHLANDRTVPLTEMLVFAAFDATIGLADAEVELLRSVLVTAGDDCGLLDLLPRVVREEALPFIGAAYLPVDQKRFASRHPADAVAVRAIAAEPPGPMGLWAVWRIALFGPDYPSPKRLYFVQASADGPGVAYRVQEALSAAGENDPLVEVFDSIDVLPEFSQRALRRAELLWTGRKLEPVRLAWTFDTVDHPCRPFVLGDRPPLDEAETNLVASYLDAGALLHGCPDPVRDVLDPRRGDIVPVGLRGDGRWIWSEAAGYYLVEHGVTPEPDLLAAIRAARHTMIEVDAVALHQSRDALGLGNRS